MSGANSAVETEFGKEVGLVHKAIVTGRKVGADKKFWTMLADNEPFFTEVVALATGAFVLARPTFSVEVDYDADPGKVFPAHVDCHKDIREFSINRTQLPANKAGKAIVEAVLFSCFNPERGWQRDEYGMEPLMKSEGCRPADKDELLALLDQHAKASSKFLSLVAYGTYIQTGYLPAAPIATYQDERWCYTHYQRADVPGYIPSLFAIGVKK